MKKAKRLFAALLACLMIVTLVPVTVFAGTKEDKKVEQESKKADKEEKKEEKELEKENKKADSALVVNATGQFASEFFYGDSKKALTENQIVDGVFTTTYTGKEQSLSIKKKHVFTRENVKDDWSETDITTENKDNGSYIYDGEEEKPIDSEGKVVGTVSDEISKKDAGTYTIIVQDEYWNGGARGNKARIEARGNVALTWVIEKADLEYTAPTAKWIDIDVEGEQALLNDDAKTEDGTFYYMISDEEPDADDEEWSDELPTKSFDDVETPETTTVWYKVVGDENHNDVAPQSIEVESYKLPTAKEDLVYNGDSKELFSASALVSGGWDAIYQIGKNNWTEKISDLKGTDAKEYSFVVFARKAKNSLSKKIDYDYVKLGEVKGNIAKASLVYTAPAAVEEYVKFNSFKKELIDQELVTSGIVDRKHGKILYGLGTATEAPLGKSWSEHIPEDKYAGKYYVWYRVVSTDKNYEGVEPTLVVDKDGNPSELKPIVILPEVVDETLVYNAGDQVLLKKGGIVFGFKGDYDVVYSAEEENGWHTHIDNVTGKDAGTYTIKVGVTYAKWPHISDENVYVVDSTSVTKEIKKLNVTITPKDAEKIYRQPDSIVEFDFDVDLPEGDMKHVYEPIEFDDVEFVREEGEDVLYVEDTEEVIYDSYGLGVQLKDGAEKNYPNYNILTSVADFVIKPYNLEDAESFGIELSGFVLAYDNAAQTQPIKEEVVVFEAGENLQSIEDDITYTLKAADYEVVGNRAVDNGIYKLSIKAKEKGNYIGAQKIDYKTWVILKDNNDFENKEFKGSVEIAEVTQKGAKEAEWASSNADIVKAVSLAEEVSNAADGSELEIWLDSDVANVSADEKAAIAKAAPNKTALEYIDLKIFTRLDDGEKIQVKNLNKKVAISIPLDDSQINTDATVKRTYNIVQSHEDENNLLDVEYNKDAKKITFMSDKFSVYTPVYQDVVTPKTVDGGNTWLFVVIATLAAAALVYFGMTMKKRETK